MVGYRFNNLIQIQAVLYRNYCNPDPEYRLALYVNGNKKSIVVEISVFVSPEADAFLLLRPHGMLSNNYQEKNQYGECSYHMRHEISE